MADVTVMGAGIFGLTIAWNCLQRGAQVRVIDPNGVGAGASGGILGALAPHVPDTWIEKKAFQFDSLIAATGFWREVEATSGIASGYARLGRLQTIADAHALEWARARITGAKDLWRGMAEWQVVAASDHDWAPVSPTGYLILDTLSARIHPRRACTALAAAITMRGGEIVARAAPEGKVIWATGVAGLQELNAGLGRMVGSGIKGQSALLHFHADNLPQIFADGVHVVPHADGTVAVGSTSEREYDDPDSTDEQLDEVIERAMLAVPVLRGARVMERWAGVRPRARTRAPILGAHPLRAGEFIANGGFKIGFGMAPGVGQVMADLVLEGQDNIPGEFRPEASSLPLSATRSRL